MEESGLATAEGGEGATQQLLAIAAQHRDGRAFTISGSFTLTSPSSLGTTSCAVTSVAPGYGLYSV